MSRLGIEICDRVSLELTEICFVYLIIITDCFALLLQQPFSLYQTIYREIVINRDV